MSGKLARVRWQMGQTLLPEHFVAQEEALLLDTAVRFRLLGLPRYGIAAMKWNDTLLSEGVLSIKTATLLLPSGLLLDIPGNTIASPLNLNLPGTARVAVYLHCHDKQASEDEIEANWSGDEGDSIGRRVFQVALTADRSHPEALETMKLAEFQKDPEGIWELSDDFIPPLLQVGTTPFLRSALDELPNALEAFQYKLSMDSVSYLSGGSLVTVKQCLKAVYRFQRFLANLRGQIHVHPYAFYEALKEFYVEVCFYRDTSPKHVAEAYNHDQLADCVGKILALLREQMKLAEKKSPYQPFEFKDGVWRIALPSDVREAKEVYFLIQKSQVSKAVRLDDFKMGSPSRLAIIHKLALQGIPIRKVDRPMLAHSFGPEVEFFQVAPGEEWEHALREGAAAFYNDARFEEMEFYLYWHFG